MTSRTSQRRLTFWVLGFATVTTIFLLVPIRLLIQQQEEVDLIPFMSSRAIPAFTGLIVLLSVLLVFVTSRVGTSERQANIILLAAAIGTVGLIAVVGMKLAFNESPDLQNKVSQSRTVE